MSDFISKKELYHKLGEAYNKGYLAWGANEIIKDILGVCDSVEKKGEGRPKGQWEIFGFPTSDDILYCQEEFICSECRDFKVNRYMRATYNFCPNCGADMRGKAE